MSWGFPDENLSHYFRNIISNLVLTDTEAGGSSTVVFLVVGGGPPVLEAAWVAYLKCTLQGLASQTY